MSKRRSHAGPDHEPRRAGPERPDRGVDVDEQQELGNATLQGRLGAPATASPDDAAPRAAAALVQHALAALHLEPADVGRLDRLTALVERSALRERDALVDRLHASETSRSMVDRALDRWFGGHDAESRWRADAALAATRDALAAELGGPVAAPPEVAGAATAEALDVVRERGGEAIAGFCQTLALAVLLDEEEEEEPFADADGVGVD